jgi:hypothetical protein
VLKEKLDDEDDDANVPEEENEAEVELQKSNMRVFAKCPSSNAFLPNELPPETVDQMRLVRVIGQEIERLKDRKQIIASSQRVVDCNATIPTQVLLQTNFSPHQYLANTMSDYLLN